MQRKASFHFAFLSLICTLTSSKILALGNEKKSKLSFCISLAYLYFDFIEDTGTRKRKENQAFLLHFSRLFVSLHKINNRNKMSIENNSAEYYLAQAQKANENKDIINIIAMSSKCIALCEETGNKESTLITAYILRANTLLMMGDIAGAKKDLEQALLLSNENTDVLLLQGRILAKEGNHTEAIECFSKVIALDASSVEALRERGASYLATGDRIKATEDAELIMTLSPDKVKAVSGDFKGEGSD